MKRLKPALLAVCLSCGLAASAFAADAVKTRPFNAMPADFIKGADISTLLEAEQHGAKFYNQNGQQQDAIAILKANGVNYVRLRLWVDPQDASGKTYGGGSNMDYPQLKTAIHDYTRDTIARFKQEGVLPDMVQIGNEINGGMLWPEGKSWGQGGGEFDRLAGLLNAAIGGLKENLTGGEQVKIMLHLAEGTKNDTFRWWFDEIAKRGVPFDIIGLSMYTYWNGPISALKANMDDISRRYNKDVIVVEAAYGYTLDNCDNAENSFQAKEEKDGGYPGTVQGQYDYIHDLMQSVIDVPDHRGKGIFYWEPTWIAVPGTTWATKAGMKYIHDEWKEGNARENQALFDCQGKVLPSITVFK